MKRICIFCEKEFKDTRKGFPKYGICPECVAKFLKEIVKQPKEIK